MTNNMNAASKPPDRQRPRTTRGLPQYLLAGIVLAYLAFCWRFLDPLLMLVNIDMISSWTGLLIVAGTAFLAVGAARSLYDARLGKYCLLLAALELAVAAPQIGNWDYKLIQSMLATLAAGIAIALLGAWLAYRARQS